MRNTTKLRELVERRAGVIVPGAANALFARVVEELDFECVYVSGAAIANMSLGVPDIGLTSLTDVVEVVNAISQSVDLPLIVDADTGFGNAVNTYRAVRLLEKAGASAIQIEDQVFPKKCGHFTGKEIIPTGEMVQKIKAAVDARQDEDLIIIARTDSIAVEGVDQAIERAHAFVEAGADMTFIEAPTDKAQIARIPAEVHVPQIANVVFGGKTPDLGAEGFGEMGFSIVLYANAALQAALHGSYQVLSSLRETGSLNPVADLLSSFEERQKTVRKDIWDELEARYKL